MSLCGIHRDPDVWSKPDEFVPERWLSGAPEEATEAEKRAWMPFGDGIRMSLPTFQRKRFQRCMLERLTTYHGVNACK